MAIQVGQQPSWTEVQEMSMLDRYAYMYGRAITQGATVNWKNGAVSPPKSK